MPDTHTNARFSHWRKSSRSNGQNGNCVEVGFTSDAVTAGVRDTKDRSYGTLEITGGAWSAFLSNIKAGNLDL